MAAGIAAAAVGAGAAVKAYQVAKTAAPYAKGVGIASKAFNYAYYTAAETRYADSEMESLAIRYACIDCATYTMILLSKIGAKDEKIEI